TEHVPTPPRPAGAPTRPTTAEEARDRPGPASALDVINAAGRVPILLDLRQDAGTAATTALAGPVDASAQTVELSVELAALTGRRSGGAGIGEHGRGGPAQSHCFDLIITG